MKYLMSLILVLSTFTSMATKPIAGMWWNSDESGRGLDIELRNGILLTTFFGYADDGKAQWWQGVGREAMPGSGVYKGEFNAAKDGQCVDCVYDPAELDAESSIGEFTLEFTTSQKGTLSWAGGETDITKYNYAFGEYLDYAYGLLAYQVIDEALGQEKGQFSAILSINAEEQQNGERVLTGNRYGFDGDDDYAVLVTSDVDDNGDSVLAIQSHFGGWTDLFIGHADADKMKGRFWSFQDGGTPEGEGFLAIGHRVEDQYEHVILPNSKSANKGALIDERRTVYLSNTSAPDYALRIALKMNKFSK